MWSIAAAASASARQREERVAFLVFAKAARMLQQKSMGEPPQLLSPPPPRSTPRSTIGKATVPTPPQLPCDPPSVSSMPPTRLLAVSPTSAPRSIYHRRAHTYTSMLCHNEKPHIHSTTLYRSATHVHVTFYLSHTFILELTTSSRAQIPPRLSSAFHS